MVAVPSVQKTAGCNASNAVVIRWLAIAMFLGGIGMLIGMWSQQDHARRCQAWPTTTGRVVSTRVEQVSDDGKMKYYPVIRYSYAVNDVTFESERYKFGSTRRSKRAAEQLCGSFATGSDVKVYYDPARPSEAVLVVPSAGGAIALGIGGVVLMALGGFVFTLCFRSAAPVAPLLAAGA